jgi:hypothetical protein
MLELEVRPSKQKGPKKDPSLAVRHVAIPRHVRKPRGSCYLRDSTEKLKALI